jgi:hypothetical protein
MVKNIKVNVKRTKTSLGMIEIAGKLAISLSLLHQFPVIDILSLFQIKQ